MSYREVEMWEILGVLRDRFRGESLSGISRRSGHSRMTVRRYLRAAVMFGWDPEQEPDEELAGKVYRKLRPVSSESGLGSSEQVLMPWRKQIEKWLKPAEGEKRGLRLTKVATLLRRRGVEVPYSSLNHFAVRNCGFADTGGRIPFG